MFSGESSLVSGILISAAIVVVLLILAWVLVRRYSLSGIRHGRSKVPRLSIVDAMPVDARRRLVLVRRDNVEHLILIGGPSDLVVEQTIVRQRRPKAVTEDDQAVAVPQPDMPALEAAAPQSLPIPFPAPRPTPPAPAVAPTPAEVPVAAPAAVAMANGSGNGAYPAPERNFTFRRANTAAAPASAPAAPPPNLTAPQRAAMPAEAAAPSSTRFLDLQRPTRIEAPVAPPIGPDALEPAFPDLPVAEDGPLDLGMANLDSEAGPAPHGTRDPSPFGKPLGQDDAPAKVSELEREMARLLGEITQKRPS